MLSVVPQISVSIMVVNLFWLALFLFFFYGLKNKFDDALKNSIVIATLLMLYLVLFGFGLPISINKNLFN
jgi:hypothetical protein